MLKIGVFGASGRVGRLIIEQIENAKDLELGAVFVRKELDFSLPNGSFVTNDIGEFIRCCDVVIDFSSPQATKILLQAIQKIPTPCVIGTTGLTQEEFELMDSAAKLTPILYASNMSMGVAILNNIVKEVASKLLDSDIEISEIHHHFKKDAPSGTALSLAKSCAQGRGLDINKVLITDRKSSGERKKDEISVVSLRGGDVVGRHTVGFYMNGEFLEFTHNATNRLTFAKGAITCALWIVSKPPKLYEISEVFS